MLPRKNRLHRDRDLHLVFRSGKRVEHPLAWGRFLPKEEDGPKMAFVVSKGVKLATSRNRLKRLFREAARCLLPRLSGGWMVIAIKSQALETSFEEACECVTYLCKKAGMLSAG